MEVKTVGLASDHAGFPMKQFVLQYLEKKGYPVKDYGTYSDESVDYPDFAHALAEGIENGDVYPGIGICGSGEGMAMTLNKHQGVRAGLAWNKDIAQLIRQHNDANVMRSVQMAFRFFVHLHDGLHQQRHGLGLGHVGPQVLSARRLFYVHQSHTRGGH